MVQLLWKTFQQFLRKLNRTLAYSPAIVFLPKGAENLHAYKKLYQMFIAAVFIKVKMKTKLNTHQ